jgi:DNA-binding NtrC family response regulator
MSSHQETRRIVVSQEVRVLSEPDFEAIEAGRYIRRPPVVDLGSDIIEVLSVSPIQEDHETLEGLLSRTNWKIQRANSLSSGLARLRQNRVPVVISERDLLPGTWQEIFVEAAQSPLPPFVIVTSRLADESLWAEALNIGAYDVLAKPLDAQEVVRVVSLAWLHWKDQYEVDGGWPKRVMTATSH